MTVPGRRPQRIGEQIREEISNLLLRGLKDPRIGFATVTAVRVSPDLRQAWVYVSVLGSAVERQETLHGLEAASTFVRRELAHRLRMRHVPALQFELDTSAEYGARIEELIEQTHRQKPDTDNEEP
ncbi:MAG: 30S ribosome-binding factor RbfA [Acidobacteria bacterium]|nr:30S ribosome-binding factor RbfA [Acidobacteriota bacterium]